MAIARLISAGIALLGLIAVVGCNSTSEPAQTFDYNLRLTTDSMVYCPFGGCGPATQFADTLTGHMTFGRNTTDFSPPEGGLHLGTIVEAYDDVVFAGNTTGKALVDSDGILTVAVGPDATNSNPYDFFTFTGKVVNGSYSGQFIMVLNGHTNAYGSFVTVP